MVTFVFVGKTENEYLDFIKEYKKRIEKFSKIEIIEIHEIKNIGKLTIHERKKKEAQQILEIVKNNDYIILLDEKGETLTSLEFSKFIEKKQQVSFNLIFIIGGPYGFDESIYKRGNTKISLSSMTLTHQMVRLFIIEQVYRSFTIINKTPYHH